MCFLGAFDQTCIPEDLVAFPARKEGKKERKEGRKDGRETACLLESRCFHVIRRQMCETS